MTTAIPATERALWQVPSYSTTFWNGRSRPHCVVIPVINEGERILNLLRRMAAVRIADIADVIIVDGGSTDGSLEPQRLQELGVRGLLVKTAPGKLSAQLRCAYAFVLDEGYTGIVTIDGNDKDDPDAIPRFIEAIEQGYDFVQASRFLAGGVAENTPKSRDFASRFIHAQPGLGFPLDRHHPGFPRLQSGHAAGSARGTVPRRVHHLRAAGLSVLPGTEIGLSLRGTPHRAALSEGRGTHQDQQRQR